ncbi:MAG: helix-turn-helix transcriptional regulator [Candidatus Gastranaerophilales bacterium]|nr:helix-turn-helix transcriptional regulator [Candidatus Gastranaerophilales bacterium]
MSQAEFAFALGEKTSRINSIESGKQRKIPSDLAEKILKIFPEPDLSFKWIITGEEDSVYMNNLLKDNIELPENLKKFILKISKQVTEKELDLIFECLGNKKELTLLLLKKLQDSENQVKKFLLQN